MQNGGAYDVDLAYVHDTGYGDFARSAGPALLEIIAQGGDAPGHEAPGLVVDLGCGSGIWAKTLVDAGYRVVGIDVSPAMIEMARQRVPAGSFQIGTFVDFPIPACRAVTALGEVFNYLFDDRNSLAGLCQIFRSVFAALVPGGVFIFDVAGPGRSSGLKQLFREGDDWACLVEYQHDEPRQQLTRRIVTFRKFGETYRRHEEYHRQQLYPIADIAGILRDSRFLVEVVTSYGGVAFPAGLAGFVGRKPAADAAR